MDNVVVYTEDDLIPARKHYPPWDIKMSDLQGRFYNEFRKADYVVYLHNYNPYILKNRFGNDGYLPTEQIEAQKRLLETSDSVVETICSKQQKFLADVIRDARWNDIGYEYINMAVLTLQRCWYVKDSVSSVVLNKIRTQFQK